MGYILTVLHIRKTGLQKDLNLEDSIVSFIESCVEWQWINGDTCPLSAGSSTEQTQYRLKPCLIQLQYHYTMNKIKTEGTSTQDMTPVCGYLYSVFICI